MPENVKKFKSFIDVSIDYTRTTFTIKKFSIKTLVCKQVCWELFLAWFLRSKFKQFPIIAFVCGVLLFFSKKKTKSNSICSWIILFKQHRSDSMEKNCRKDSLNQEGKGHWKPYQSFNFLKNGYEKNMKPIEKERKKKFLLFTVHWESEREMQW